MTSGLSVKGFPEKIGMRVSELSGQDLLSVWAALSRWVGAWVEEGSSRRENPPAFPSGVGAFLLLSLDIRLHLLQLSDPGSDSNGSSVAIGSNGNVTIGFRNSKALSVFRLRCATCLAFQFADSLLWHHIASVIT